MRENIVLNSSSLEFFESQDCRFESRQTNSLKYIERKEGSEKRNFALWFFGNWNFEPRKMGNFDGTTHWKWYLKSIVEQRGRSTRYFERVIFAKSIGLLIDRVDEIYARPVSRLKIPEEEEDSRYSRIMNLLTNNFEARPTEERTSKVRNTARSSRVRRHPIPTLLQSSSSSTKESSWILRTIASKDILRRSERWYGLERGNLYFSNGGERERAIKWKRERIESKRGRFIFSRVWNYRLSRSKHTRGPGIVEEWKRPPCARTITDLDHFSRVRFPNNQRASHSSMIKTARKLLKIYIYI